MKLELVEAYSGRVDVVVTWLDGRVTRLARANPQEAADTIDARYRSELVSSARVLSFPGGEPVELPDPSVERHWVNGSGSAEECVYCGEIHRIGSLSQEPGQAARASWWVGDTLRVGVVEAERPGMLRVWVAR